ncbi:MAG TPA: DUF3107 domain-containing protein [Trebonia sp.]
MEVKIGIQSISRELIVETDATAEEVERTLAAALAGRSADGTGETGGTGAPLFALATQKGGRILIPADKVAYVEFSTDQARRVGFGNIG